MSNRCEGFGTTRISIVQFVHGKLTVIVEKAGEDGALSTRRQVLDECKVSGNSGGGSQRERRSV